MGTVTQYDMANIQAALGGSNPISLNEYYRGGPFVPTTRTTSSTEGPRYNGTNQWRTAASDNSGTAVWDNAGYNTNSTTTTLVVGLFTYLRGAFQGSMSSKFGPINFYAISRSSSSTVSINTGVPSSGTISIGQLFGASNP